MSILVEYVEERLVDEGVEKQHQKLAINVSNEDEERLNHCHERCPWLWSILRHIV